ncbi:MAG: SUF system NifU family Fe-S cluster assembly protein [Acidobacteriia bacterium]|nr:SUF system NifU family Fe-S cluster assembly protein [Methyloceanibacter sp.]MCL6492603.1 SUF system NifU family Fe-S cluster assembly protein [Terriglobia bacterium]
MSENFDDLRDLYQEVILDHGRRPRHAGRLEDFDATAKGDNPMCGDRVQIWLKYGPDGRIVDAVFEARGCAISVASADLMAEVVTKATPEEARSLFEKFRTMVRSGTCPECAEEEREKLEQLAPLSGVHEFPSRVKCATLPWHALIAAMNGATEASSE